MEELLARSGFDLKTFNRGDVVEAKVNDISSTMVSLAIGGKSEGVVTGPYLEEIKSYLKDIKVGDTVSAVVIDPETPEGYVRLSLKQFATDEVWRQLEEADDKDSELEVVGKVATPKGIIVEFHNMTGFIPMSQLGAKAAKNPEDLVESQITVKVLEIDKRSGKVVFSEREVSEREIIELRRLAQDNFKEGEVYDAIIKEITNYGIFIELSTKINKKPVDVEGFVHISELSWDKIEDPHDHFQIGDKIKVAFLGAKDDKLTMSAKLAQKDPWEDAVSKYTKDDKFPATVVKKSSFGVFVQLEPGIEGLIHITKIPPEKEIKKGDEVMVYIEEVNKQEKKISLGLVLTAKPVGYK